MLGNDTWFMYEAGKKDLTSDGFGGVKIIGTAMMAEGDTPPAPSAPRDTSAKSNSLNLDDIRATCEKETMGFYSCHKKKNGRPRLPNICQERIKGCMRMRTKLTGKLIEADQSRAITGGLEVENSADAAKVAAKNKETDAPDNTMMYIGIAVGVLVLGGVGAYFLLKKPAVVPAA
jgi:hypothetical protein